MRTSNHARKSPPATWEEVFEAEKSRLGKGPYAALCLSGGGMRSATFCLGFIRGIGQLIPGFHYLSTVSGGGYAGGWLSSLLQKNSWPQVVQILENRAAQAEEIRHLRRYSDLLEARSWLSTAALRLASSYLRSLVIWWLLYIPVAFALAALPWLISMLEQVLRAPVRPMPALGVLIGSVAAASVSISMWTIEEDPHAVPVRRSWAIAFSALAVFAAGAARGATFPTPPSMAFSWLAEYGLWVLVTVVFAIAGGVIPAMRRQFGRPWETIATIGALALGLAWAGADTLLDLLSPVISLSFPFEVPLFAVGAWLCAAVVVGALGPALKDEQREAFSDVSGQVIAVCLFVSLASGLALHAEALKAALQGQFEAVAATMTLGGLVTAYSSYRSRVGTGKVAGWRKYAAHLATAVAVGFGVIVWLLLSLAWTSIVPDLRGWRLSAPSAWLAPAVLSFGAAFLALVAYRWSKRIGVNAFSLNGLYRARIVRTFLASPDPPGKVGAAAGFAESDDMLLTSTAARRSPLHLVNVVLNDAGQDRLEWRDRRAVPFVLSDMFCGSKETGFRPTDEYAGGKLTLGRAIAISGAAANPSMGHFSSRPVTWLLGLFNLRLGWWLGNPKHDTVWRLEEPADVMWPFVEEFLARSSESSEFVNLSDGGHFENLGVYEAIRRQCQYIVAVDASHDPDGKHLDLARAERLVRMDLGVELTWEMASDTGHYRVARINYPNGDIGHLVYVSPQLTGNEPADVLAYAQQSRDRGEHFPHQSTSDLWFDEEQFESYMKLGQHSAAMLLEDLRPVLLDTGLDMSPAAIAGLRTPVFDVRQDAPRVVADRMLAGSEPPPRPFDSSETLADPKPHGEPRPKLDVERRPTLEVEPRPWSNVDPAPWALRRTEAIVDSWWKQLVIPIGASVVATTSVIGVSHLISNRTTESRSNTSTVIVSRTATVFPRREQTILLPWFDEIRPTPQDIDGLIDLAKSDLAGLSRRLAELNDLARSNPKAVGAPLRPLDIERVRRLASMLGEGCQPVVVRGLASTSQIVTDQKPRDEYEAAEIKACTTPDVTSPLSDCRNVLLANRRAELMAAMLTTAGVGKVVVRPWDKNDARPMFDAQFDDRDPATNETGAATDRYIVRRGAFNRSVELIPEGDGCDVDALQRTLAVMIVDRPY